MLTHRNMVANLQQTTAWLSKDMREGQELVITALPLYHIFALTANCMTFIKFGALNWLITNPRDWAGFVKELDTPGALAPRCDARAPHTRAAW